MTRRSGSIFAVNTRCIPCCDTTVRCIMRSASVCRSRPPREY